MDHVKRTSNAIAGIRLRWHGIAQALKPNSVYQLLSQLGDRKAAVSDPFLHSSCSDPVQMPAIVFCPSTDCTRNPGNPCYWLAGSFEYKEPTLKYFSSHIGAIEHVDGSKRHANRLGLSK